MIRAVNAQLLPELRRLLHNWPLPYVIKCIEDLTGCKVIIYHYKEDKMIKYRVIIKVSYNESWFEFDTMEKACEFASTALTSMVDSEDQSAENIIRIDLVKKGGKKNE